MRKLALLVVATAAMIAPLAGSASADERCYTPRVGHFDSFEVCYFLPIEPTP